MTRLRTDMIEDIPAGLGKYDKLLTDQTGCCLLEIALRACGLTTAPNCPALPVAVVPMTAGQGVISGFGQTVQAIVSHLGFPAYVTVNSDVAGLAEALDQGVKILFMADDQKFVAFNVASGTYTDNSIATGKAFVTALDAAAGGLSGQKVAVLGAGPVGTAAVRRVVELGALPVVFDPDHSRAALVQDAYPVQLADSLTGALAVTPLVIDATPVPEIITPDLITPDTIIACPGVPHGLTPEAAEKLSPLKFIHDPLQLGVAAMVISCAEPEQFKS